VKKPELSFPRPRAGSRGAERAIVLLGVVVLLLGYGLWFLHTESDRTMAARCRRCQLSCPVGAAQRPGGSRHNRPNLRRQPRRGLISPTRTRPLRPCCPPPLRVQPAQLRHPQQPHLRQPEPRL